MISYITCPDAAKLCVELLFKRFRLSSGPWNIGAAYYICEYEMRDIKSPFAEWLPGKKSLGFF